MNKLSVTPIGTCRITNPLRQAQSRFPIEFNRKRNYGYTHTSDEALQQLRYLQGDKKFCEEAKPIIFRPGTGEVLDSEVWHPSDLIIVEISSAKKITCGPDSVQINYLYRHFADFFSNGSRTAKFWSLVRRNLKAELIDFLSSEPTFGEMSADDQALLTNLRMEQQDFDAIKADMSQIVDRVGREGLLFVTHVNARTPDGSAIPSRERVIGWVRSAAEQLQVRCFDPTETMLQFGQERAMEQGGLDLTHFTPSFSDQVYADLHRQHVVHLMDQLPSASTGEDDSVRQQLLADNIEALMRFDDFRSGARRLFAALRKEPDAAPLIRLRGKVLAELGDFEGAIRDLAGRSCHTSQSTDSRVALLEAFIGAQDWINAIEVAEGLLSDEFESSLIYHCAATACEQLGRADDALSYWKHAFRHDRANLNAALRVLTLLSQPHFAEQLGTWREEVLEYAGQSTTGASDIARWALLNRDEELLTKVFGGIAQCDAIRAEEFLSEILEANLYEAGAACLNQLLQHNGSMNSRQRQQLADRFNKLSVELLGTGNFKDAYLLADAALQARADRVATKTRRMAQAHYRTIIREAYRIGDYQAVADTWAEVSGAMEHNVDVIVPAALSLHKLGRNDAALELLLKARQVDPTNVGIQRWLGRTATILGRFEIALPSYAAVRQSTDPAAAKFSREVTRFFATAERRAFKQMREAVQAESFEFVLNFADQLQGYIDDWRLFDSELARVNRLLRIKLREIERGDAEDENRERILALLLRMQPDDPAILRRAALEMMRKGRFREAGEYWGRLDRQAPGTEANSRNLEKCRVLAARQEKSAAATKPVMAG